jgi:PAS domain S-box-containing protein
LEVLAEAVLIEDSQGLILFANQKVAAIYGYPSRELVGMPIDKLVPEDSRFLLRRHKRHCLDRKTMEPDEPLSGLLARHRDGRLLPIDLQIGRLEIDGTPVIVSSIRSRRYQFTSGEEAALRQQQQRAQRYLDIAAVMLVVIDADHRVSLINRKGLEILGCGTEEEVLGKDWFAHFLPARQRESVVGVFEKLIRGDLEPVEYYENPVLRADGTERIIAWHNSPLYDNAGRINGILSSGQDITERKLADERLRRQLRFTQAITDCAAESIFLTDVRGRITMVNPEAERLFGYTQDEFMGQVLHDLLHYQHPDGTPYPFTDCPNCRIYHLGTTVRHNEVVFFRKDGKAVTVACSNAQVEIEGVMSGAVLVTHDISERKAFEEALQEADRCKDEFLAMLAHELRNPLAPILNAAQILSLTGPDETRIKWSQEIIERQVKHLSRLVDELLDVSRIARGKITLKREPLELSEVVAQVEESIRPFMQRKGQELEIRLPPQPVHLRGDLVRLVQVLLNVLDNAAKYSPEGSRVELEAEVQAGEVVIRVRDQGEGISAELLPHVFELFRQGERSLDRSQGGLGMGLTLVQRLLELHGGRVEMTSSGVGQGSLVSMHLPLDRSPQEASPQTGRKSLKLGSRRILVVDDEQDVADSTALILQASGHHVQVAYSGEDAIELARHAPPEIVFLDIGLKGMDGYRTAAALRQLPAGKQMRLVASSGYGDEKSRSRAEQAGFDHYLVKPITIEQLSELLASMTGWGGQRD